MCWNIAKGRLSTNRYPRSNLRTSRSKHVTNNSTGCPTGFSSDAIRSNVFLSSFHTKYLTLCHMESKNFGVHEIEIRNIVEMTENTEHPVKGIHNMSLFLTCIPLYLIHTSHDAAVAPLHSVRLGFPAYCRSSVTLSNSWRPCCPAGYPRTAAPDVQP